MITEATEAEIRRLYDAEHWRIGTIARQLKLHHDVVRRVLQLSTPTKTRGRPSIIEDFVPLIEETLHRFPTLRATALFDMLRARGFNGSVRTVRLHVARLRPRQHREAFLRTTAFIGEQSQIDWAFVGNVEVDGTKRAMWMFVIVLSWSRASWAEMCFSMDAGAVARSLVRAAAYFGGVTRQWLFDNPKTVVVDRAADSIRFHPQLLATTMALRVEPRLCAPRRPQEKGKVERAIRYMRERALSAYTPTTIADGNERLRAFYEGVALDRPHPNIANKTVRECLAEEKAKLLSLPAHLPSLEDMKSVVVDKTAFVRFDCNDYSVPPEFVGRDLIVLATDAVVRILNIDVEVARHARSYGKRVTVEDKRHREALLAQKKLARDGKRREQLQHRFPAFAKVMARWLDDHRNVGSSTSKCWPILEQHGDEIFAQALDIFIERGLHEPSALGGLCEDIARRRQPAVPRGIAPAHPTDRDVIPHRLEAYDERK
jgi:transposase